MAAVDRLGHSGQTQLCTARIAATCGWGWRESQTFSPLGRLGGTSRLLAPLLACLLVVVPTRRVAELLNFNFVVPPGAAAAGRSPSRIRLLPRVFSHPCGIGDAHSVGTTPVKRQPNAEDKHNHGRDRSQQQCVNQ